MSRFIESAEYLLPVGNGSIPRVFDQVLLRHNLTGINPGDIRNLDWKERMFLGKDMLLAGLGYLANKSDREDLNDIGYAAWYAINNLKAIIGGVADNLKPVAEHLGFSPAAILSLNDYNSQPQFIIEYSCNNAHGCKIIHLKSALLTPISFIERALRNPVEGLGLIAETASMIRDITFLSEINTEVNQMRSEACSASVALEFISQNSNMQLPDFLRNSLQKYPKGTASLPSGIWYPNPEYIKTKGDPSLN